MDENKFQIFKHERFGNIRIVMADNGEPRFCLADICRSLDLLTKKVAQRLEDEVLSKYPISDSIGRQQFVLFVDEVGLYDVILDSRKPEAKAFRKWLTSEVLPSIRKTGSYSLHQTQDAYSTCHAIEKAIADPDFVIGLLTQMKEERAIRKTLEEDRNRQNLLLQAKDEQIEELEVKATYAKYVLEHEGELRITPIANDYGMSAKELNHLLHELGIQKRVNRQWMLCSKYQGLNYMTSGTKVSPSGKSYIDSFWTQKGRLFIYAQLKKAGILPLMERDANTPKPPNLFNLGL